MTQWELIYRLNDWPEERDVFTTEAEAEDAGFPLWLAGFEVEIKPVPSEDREAGQ